jgi:hypothetical protein
MGTPSDLGARRAPARAALAALLAFAACSHAAALDGAHGDAMAADQAPADTGSADAGAPADSPHALCTAACAHAPAACPSPDCVEKCEGIVNDPRCGAWARPLIACQAQTTAQDSFCLNGLPTLKESACTMETRMWAACYISGTGQMEGP